MNNYDLNWFEISIIKDTGMIRMFKLYDTDEADVTYRRSVYSVWLKILNTVFQPSTPINAKS